MLCWSSVLRFSKRLFQSHSIKTEPLLDQLKKCNNEYQVLQLLGMNRSVVTVHHVGYVMNILWNIQKGKPNGWRTLDHLRDHPEFIALRVLAQNKIDLMNDNDLIDVLQAVESFQVEGHDPLVQQLIVEGWRRLEWFDLPALSKFAYCLKKQEMTTSPLMGKIANIVDKNLDNTEDPETLSSFLISLQAVSSVDLLERLTEKTESVIDKLNASHFKLARKVMQLFPKYKYSHASLLDKCDQFFTQNINAMDIETLCHVASMYQYLNFNNSDFLVLAKPRLVVMMDLCNDANSFAKVFGVLGRMPLPEMRERFESKLLTIADEFNLLQLLIVLKTMQEMKCRNTVLIQKIASLLQKHLDTWTPVQLLNVTEGLVELQYQNAKLFRELEMCLKRNITSHFRPHEVAALIKALSLLSVNQVDEAIISKVDAVIPQCNLKNLEKIAIFCRQLLRTAHTPKNQSDAYRELLQKVNSYGLKRVQKMENIDLLLKEIRFIESTGWMNKEFMEGLLDACQSLVHQVTWKNVTGLSVFTMHMNILCTSFQDKIAMVTMEDIKKIHPLAVYLIVYSFSFLNYEPPQGREFFNVCIQYVLDHLDSFSPFVLIRFGYNFALAECFPKALVNAIFNMKFLNKLDAQVDTVPSSMSTRVRQFLMELNRAVCIERPEYRIPWFHGPYCEQMRRNVVRFTHHQIHQLLGEILGGVNYTKMFVATPYSYSLDFEFILDKDNNPIAYAEEDNGNQLLENTPLPQGAQRFAVNLLSSNAFCKYTSHLKGSFAMKKRHLEILGYNVVQIPLQEWKSVTLEKEDACKTYLWKKIFGDN